MKTELYLPSRCTSKLPDDLEKENLVGEEKLDGSRYVLYLGCDPYERSFTNNTIISRRVSVVDNKHVDRSLNLPHITESDYGVLNGTVIDGEVMANDFLGTNSILNSNPDLAIQKQEKHGWLTFNAFDVMAFRGKDIRGLPLYQRRKVLEEVANRIGNPYLKVIPQFSVGLESEFSRIVGAGGEGIIVKDLRQGYGCGWSKMKKSYDVSTVITGWKPGNGKYKDQVGSLAFSVWHNGGLVEIGYASGFDDPLRKEMTENFSQYEGKVLDVFIQEIQKGKNSGELGRTRHATFSKIRDDMNSQDCTYEKLMADMKKKARSNRNKIV